MEKVRVAVVGAGAFGANHLRVLHECLTPIWLPSSIQIPSVRTRGGRAIRVSVVVAGLPQLREVDAAIVAAPTSAHADIGCELLEMGIDVLVEKPIAGDLASPSGSSQTAETNGRVLQVGHLERFNPAVQALTGK